MPDRSTTSGGAASSKKAARPKKRGRWRAFWRTGLIVVLSLVLLGMGTLVAAYSLTSFPDPNAQFTTNKSIVYYRDGTTQIGSFADQNRTTIDFDKMPQSIKDAVVAAENRDFWTDKGISPSGISRSVWRILTGGEVAGGGSTITQQYIKILYLTSDQTATRKSKELLLAVKMGRSMAKEDILAGYLNTIYFGRGAYGIQAAARAYFNVDAGDLTLQQSAVLASVLNNPGLLDPSVNPTNTKRLTERYKYVLDGMLAAGNITQAEHDQAASTLPEFPDVPLSSRFGGPKGFLLKMVEAELLANGVNAALISGGGLQITTTFDANAQQAAVDSAQKWTQQAATSRGQDPNQLHAAIASVEVGTGEVLAMYGGADYVANSRNWATTDRPAASTFKAYAVAAGLRNGFNLRTKLNGNTFTPKGDTSSVRNEFGTQYGTVSLVKATADSINTAFVDLTQQIKDGPSEVVRAANDAGVATGAGWDLNNRIALGTAEVSPLDQATGYATFANKGVAVGSHMVREVKDMEGNVIYSAKVATKQAFDQGVAADVTFALKNVVQEGTGAKVSSLGYDIAGKTGTAGVGDNVVSSWFVAYTAQVSTAVMYVAGDAGTGDLDPFARKGDATFFGGTYPALTWLDYMKVAMSGKDKIDLPDAAYVNSSASPTPDFSTSRPTSTGTSDPTSTSTATSTAQEASPDPTRTRPTSAPSETKTSAPSVEPSVAPSREPSVEPSQPQATGSVR